MRVRKGKKKETEQPLTGIPEHESTGNTTATGTDGVRFDLGPIKDSHKRWPKQDPPIVDPAKIPKEFNWYESDLDLDEK